MKDYPFELVWMTTQASGTPHARALQEANPGLAIGVWESREGEGEERTMLWRNCDRNIRAWAQANAAGMAGAGAVFFEWDVYCNADVSFLAEPLARGVDIAGAEVMSCVKHVRHFWPFQDIPKLPREMQGLACAIAPLGVVVMSRRALVEIAKAEHDAVFAADIFCEVRLPTVLRKHGYRVGSVPLPWVDATPKMPGEFLGIYHPVKMPTKG